MVLLQVSPFSINGVFKLSLAQCEVLRTKEVTAVQIVKPSEANNGCDLGSG